MTIITKKYLNGSYRQLFHLYYMQKKDIEIWIIHFFSRQYSEITAILSNKVFPAEKRLDYSERHCLTFLWYYDILP